RVTRSEWFGVGFGIAGVAALCLDSTLRANPGSVALMLFAAACWSVGSILCNRIDVAPGLMGNAAEMLAGGLLLGCLSVVRGEHVTVMPTPGAILALAYLTIFGSLGAMSAYLYLLRTVQPALALVRWGRSRYSLQPSNGPHRRYSFVNPGVALFVGVVLG